MRLILNMRGVNVIDLELHWPHKPQPTEPEPTELEATSGGSFERADAYGDPATLSGFGFRASHDGLS